MSALAAPSLERQVGPARLPELHPLSFSLPPELEAPAPPEYRGMTRDAVRMLVATKSDGALVHSHFSELPRFLDEGDLVVINTSGTLAAELDGAASDGSAVQVHLSTQLPAGLWTVEVRRDGEAHLGAAPGDTIALPDGGHVALLAPYSPGPGGAGVRLWVSRVETPERLHSFLARHGRPIRYGYVRGSYPITAYQNVYATEPGSAEMPSAGRPFTPEVLTRLVAKGVGVAPLLLHTGVASLEASEPPYAEYFRVSLGHRPPHQRHPPLRWPRHRHRHHRGARARVRGRRTWARAPERGMDRDRRVTRAARPLHRRLPHRLARARGLAPRHARGHRGAAAARGVLRRRAGRGLPLARVRRRPPDPAVTADLEATAEGATPESPLQQLPTTRRAILNLLKRQGPLDAAAVAAALSLTPAAVRMQMTRLEEDGLLTHRDEVPEGAAADDPATSTS